MRTRDRSSLNRAAARQRASFDPGAFTLVEVMIAMGIFFVAMFAILDLVATNLKSARKLQQTKVDCGLPMADLYLAAQLEQSVSNGDFGNLYPNYSWEQIIEPAEIGGVEASNGLFHVEFILVHPNGTRETNLDALLFRPDSKPRALGK